MIKRNPVIKRNNPTIRFVQLTSDTARILRMKLFKKQGKKCPVLKKRMRFDESVLDHQHKLKTQKPGPLGRGLVRGCLHFGANAFEGVILKKYKRYGLTDLIGLPALLRNLAAYLENPTAEQKFIYPSEKPKGPTLKISEYNRIVKYYKVMFPRSRVIPPYPPSKIKKVGKKKKGKKQKYKYTAKLSPKWAKLLDRANKLYKKGVKV